MVTPETFVENAININDFLKKKLKILKVNKNKEVL